EQLRRRVVAGQGALVQRPAQLSHAARGHGADERLAQRCGAAGERVGRAARVVPGEPAGEVPAAGRRGGRSGGRGGGGGGGGGEGGEDEPGVFQHVRLVREGTRDVCQGDQSEDHAGGYYIRFHGNGPPFHDLTQPQSRSPSTGGGRVPRRADQVGDRDHRPR